MGQARSVTFSSDLFRSRYPALIKGDAQAAADLLTDDSVLHVPGTSSLAGRYRGRAEILRYFAELARLSEETFRVEVLDVDERGDHTLVLTRATATRPGGEFSDEQFLRLRTRRDGIAEAWLYPGDSESHDRFWGGARPPLFTPEDRSFLLDAIRRATSRERPSGPSVLVALGVGLVAAFLAVLAYDVLHNWRRPVSLSLTAQRLTDLRHLNLSGAGGIQWQIEAAQVRTLGLIGPATGDLEILLPVAAGECPEAAQQLEGLCEGDSLRLATPVQLTWTSPQLLSNADGQGHSATSLDVTLEEEAAETLHMGILAFGPTGPRLCFSSPLDEATLELRRGALVASWGYSGQEDVVPCGEGLRVSVGSATGDQPPTVEMGGVESLNFMGRGREVNLDGLSGRLTLSPGGSHLFESSALFLRTSQKQGLGASLDFGPAKQSLRIQSSRATSALADEGELVPTEWDRDAGIILPLFAGFISILVISPIGVAVQGFMGVLGRIRRPRGQHDGW